MASNSSYETSWADQWDPEPLYTYPNHKNSDNSSSNPKLSKIVSQKFERSKEVAAVAVKKVKDGALVSVNWIKLKHNKSKLFQKK
ncbi:hypothetical protein DH2020_049782 [Rehmannia glutinosa]|uniref:Uncharacterized protein n=1 Tax=Rehmannia glutinosa TaxID=99300 RepID=A0ABR0U2C5_REHGL